MKRVLPAFVPKLLIYARYLLFLLSIYLIVLGFRGFLFASNDPVDVMSYAKFLSDPDLYPHDFYIQNIHSAFPNERWIFSSLLSWTGEHIRWLSLCFHAITTLLLFSGMYRIASLYIREEFLRWLLLLIITGPLYHTNPGACDIYYNMFISSLVAKAFGVWSIFYFLKDSSFRPFLLMIPATFIHPAVGAQLFIILTGASILRWKTIHKSRLITGFLLYFFTAGIYVAALHWKMNQNAGISQEQLFEIFEFRIAHHFFPSYFPLKTYLVAVFVWGLSIWYFIRKKAWNILALQMVILSGMVFYTIFTEFIPWATVLSSQWFKTSIWMQLIGITGILAWVDNWWTKTGKISFLKPRLIWSYPVLAGLVILLMVMNNTYFLAKKHEFFFTKYYSDEARIGLLAKKVTPQDAVFVVPMSFTEFKYFSERSLYIDYKSVVHRKDVLGDWYNRIREIYAIDVQNRRSGQDLYALADKNYLALQPEKIKEFRKKGVNYFVGFKGQSLPFRSIARNNKYIIYDLSQKNQ